MRSFFIKRSIFPQKNGKVKVAGAEQSAFRKDLVDSERKHINSVQTFGTLSVVEKNVALDLSTTGKFCQCAPPTECFVRKPLSELRTYSVSADLQ